MDLVRKKEEQQRLQVKGLELMNITLQKKLDKQGDKDLTIADLKKKLEETEQHNKKLLTLVNEQPIDKRAENRNVNYQKELDLVATTLNFKANRIMSSVKSPSSQGSNQQIISHRPGFAE